MNAQGEAVVPSQALALRSRIVLACGEGIDTKAIAVRPGCSLNTVGRWRNREDIRDRVKNWHENPKPFIWTTTAEQILEPLTQLPQRVADARH